MSDSVADAYAVGLRDARLAGWCNEDTSELVTGFEVSRGAVVLDYGAGEPDALRFCAARRSRLIVADADANRVRSAAAWAAEWGEVPEQHVTDADPLPLADASVDRVICLEVLRRASDPAALLRELVRVGRPGARFLLAVPDEAVALLHGKAQGRFLARGAFDQMVRDAGLEISQRLHGGFFRAMWEFLADHVGEDAAHPVLQHFTRTWELLLEQEDGARVKRALDRFLPGYQAIVAAKPVVDAGEAGRVGAASQAFTRIYENDAWGLAELEPEPERHQLVADLISQTIRRFGVKSMTEFGCGFWNYLTRVDLTGVTYTGYDVWPGVLSHNARQFGSDTVQFRRMADDTEFEPGDLLFSKDVLQHLPVADVRYYLDRFKARFRVLLIINDVFPEDDLNGDILPGGHRALRLDLPPFDLPHETLAEWDAPAFGVAYRKRACLVDVSRLAAQ